MNDLYWQFFNGFTCAFEVYIFYDFITHMIDRQKDAGKLTAGVKFLILSLLCLYIIGINQLPPEFFSAGVGTLDKILFKIFGMERLSGIVLNMLFIPAGLLIVSHILYPKAEIKRKISLTVVYYVASVVIEVSGGIIAERQFDLYNFDHFTSVLLVSIEKLVTFILMKCITRFGSNYTKTDKKIFAMFLFLPVSTLIINATILFISFILPRFQEIKFWLVIGNLCLLISNGMIFYIYESHMKTLQVIQLQKISMLKNVYNEKYYSSIAEQNLKYASLAHDYKNQMKTIHILAAENRLDKIMELSSAVESQYESAKKIPNYCDNDIFNAVVFINRKTANNNGIKFSVHVQPGFSCPILNDLDICTIFGNLLENAVDAAKQSKNEKFVECFFSYKKQGKIVCIKICNSYSAGKLNQTGDELLTTKKDRDTHGFGIKIVRDIVQNKYNGIFSYYADAGTGRFTVDITLMLEEYQETHKNSACTA